MFRFQNIHGVPLSVQRLKTKAEVEAGQNFMLQELEYRRYVCPDCGQHHTTESSAAECCAPIIDVVYVEDVQYDTPGELVAALNAVEPGVVCPVCSQDHDEVEGAVECCLWKTHGPAQRFAITKAVERGESWADAIAASTKGD